MLKSKNQFIQIFLIILALLSYVYGFNIREDSAGGGFYDFQNTWNNQSTFNENSLTTSLRNTKTSEIIVYINSHFPFSYILNKFLNPFSTVQKSFLNSIFILNLFLPLLFFFCLKQKYPNKDIYLLGCLSSILYLSPYFRTSAYWAGMENYGLITFLISFYFFSKFLKNDFNKKLNIILFSIFGCFCVYFDQKLLLIPLVYLYFFLKNEKNQKNITIYLTTNLILSIPIILLVFYWGGITSPHDTLSRKVGENLYFEQIGYCLTIILFYLIPYICINYKKIFEYSTKNKKNILILTLIYILYLILIIFFPSNYGSWDIYGKGWLHKLTIILFDNNFYQKILTYSVFYFSLILIYLSSQNRLIIFYFIIFFSLISIVTLPIFQEYFDPLTLIFLSLFFYNENEINETFIKFHYFFSVSFLIFMNLYY